KSKFKRKALGILDVLKKDVEENNAAALSELEASYDDLQAAQKVKERYDKVQQELEMKQSNVDQQLEHPQFNQENWAEVIRIFINSQSKFIVQESPVSL